MKPIIFCLLFLVGCSTKTGEWSSAKREAAIERLFVEHTVMEELLLAHAVKHGLSRQEALRRLDVIFAESWQEYADCQANNCRELGWISARLGYLTLEVRYGDK